MLTEATLFLSQPSISGMGTACHDVVGALAQGVCAEVTVGTFLQWWLGHGSWLPNSSLTFWPSWRFGELPNILN